MKLITRIKALLASKPVQAVEAWGQNEFDKAIAAAKTTVLGTAMAGAIQAAEDTGKTGAEKRAAVLAAVVPAIVSYATKGGLTALVSDAETFASALLESTLTDLKQTGALTIAQAVLKAVAAA
jgi:hypothetical protein